MRWNCLMVVMLGMLICIFFSVSPGVIGHPPADIQVIYDQGSGELVVKGIHEVTDPEEHFVYRVTIYKNGKLYLDGEYGSQHNTSGFYHVYDNQDLNVTTGDILDITAYCDIEGSISQRITIGGESSSGDSTPGFLLMSTVLILVLVIVIKVKKK